MRLRKKLIPFVIAGSIAFISLAFFNAKRINQFISKIVKTEDNNVKQDSNLLQFELKTWRFGKKIITLANYKKENLTVSLNCINQSEPNQLINECKILLEKISSTKFSMKTHRGGKNPGSVICKEALNSQVIFGKDINGNTRTFCKTKNNFIIDNLWIMRNYEKI